MMKLSQTLNSFLEGSETHLNLDADGQLLDTGARRGPGPLLVVSEPTDSVKVVELGRVVDAPRRDGIGEVVAVAIPRSVVESMDGEPDDLVELIAAVRAAGHEWKVIEYDGP